MDFETGIAKIKLQIGKVKDKGTEESTKFSLITPMLRALGYDTGDMDEVYPEYTASVGEKNEKVDFAILKDHEPIIFMEVKPAYEELSEKHAAQLSRYFNSTQSVKIGIITNGVQYKFYSDFKAQNLMDKKPFFEIDIENATPEQMTEFRKFGKNELDITTLIPAAKAMMTMKDLTEVITAELDNPSEEFVKFIGSLCHEGRMTQKMIKEYTPLIKNVCARIITDRVDNKLKMAILKNNEEEKEKERLPEPPVEPVDELKPTPEEIIGFHLVQAICMPLVQLDRLSMRKNGSYCSILFDDNRNKAVLRMYFDKDKKDKKIAVFSGERYSTGCKKETIVVINAVPEIYSVKEQIRATVKSYL
jgi:hypothetical protein